MVCFFNLVDFCNLNLSSIIPAHENIKGFFLKVEIFQIMKEKNEAVIMDLKDQFTANIFLYRIHIYRNIRSVFGKILNWVVYPIKKFKVQYWMMFT